MKAIMSAAVISRIQSIDERIKNLLKEKDDLLDKIYSEYEKDPELVICAKNGNTGWVRLTIFDNSELIKKELWKTIKVERFSTKIETLKTNPKNFKKNGSIKWQKKKSF